LVNKKGQEEKEESNKQKQGDTRTNIFFKKKSWKRIPMPERRGVRLEAFQIFSSQFF